MAHANGHRHKNTATVVATVGVGTRWCCPDVGNVGTGTISRTGGNARTNTAASMEEESDESTSTPPQDVGDIKIIPNMSGTIGRYIYVYIIIHIIETSLLC
mmetsp:Transcript_19903/g.29920  ORF Transcript_19903/g.29920 Transcript_19903/m.29920 type:complete len:101 (-) Transcript_19903:7-309(-)